MKYEIIEVKTKKQIRDFVSFQLKHYKGNPYYVPPIVADDVNAFLPEKNPGLADVDMKLFLCYKGSEIVGRVGALVSRPANEKWGYKNCRFSWIEFIEDYEVCKLLLDTVVNFAKERNMTTVTGPHWLNDFDMQGMLVEGFDKLATIASFYNFPYYPEYLARYGFQKDVDYVEYWSTTPKAEDIPEKLLRVNDYVIKKNKFKLVSYPSIKDYIKRGKEIFSLLEDTFKDNYGTVPLTDTQMNYYIKKYLMLLNKDLVKLVENEQGELIGFIITMPNLSKAFQKANGRLFPFGIFHLLKALKTYEVLDFYFAGVRADYRSKGVDAILATEIVKTAVKLGFRNSESNQELEDNSLVQALWKFYQPVNHKRRRIFKIEL